MSTVQVLETKKSNCTEGVGSLILRSPQVLVPARCINKNQQHLLTASSPSRWLRSQPEFDAQTPFVIIRQLTECSSGEIDMFGAFRTASAGVYNAYEYTFLWTVTDCKHNENVVCVLLERTHVRGIGSTWDAFPNHQG